MTNVKRTKAVAKRGDAARQLAQVSELMRRLEAATKPEDIKQVDAGLEAIETYMAESGMFEIESIMPVNHARMTARWKLGQALAKVERSAGPGRGRKGEKNQGGLESLLGRLGFSHDTATRLQRLGALPDAELASAKAAAAKEEHPEDRLLQFGALIKLARPWWYKESREGKHRKIKAAASAGSSIFRRGPFPLLYADPPWKFEIYSPKGLERTPDQHYPTLTDEEIAGFTVKGWTVDQLAHRDAALLLWCTSSNILRAAKVMEAWGFEYKTQAVWDKMKTGLGLVFRNQHEVLLYGTRGKMPGPQYQPPSVFRYPRGRHSAKPPEIRREIEKMYPAFDEETRVELFAREQNEGWTSYGYEAVAQAAE